MPVGRNRHGGVMYADADPLVAHWECNRCRRKRTQRKRQRKPGGGVKDTSKDERVIEVKKDPHNPRRFAIFVDGKFVEGGFFSYDGAMSQTSYYRRPPTKDGILR